jgi:hypothetical protein
MLNLFNKKRKVRNLNSITIIVHANMGHCRAHVMSDVADLGEITGCRVFATYSDGPNEWSCTFYPGRGVVEHKEKPSDNLQ